MKGSNSNLHVGSLILTSGGYSLARRARSFSEEKTSEAAQMAVMALRLLLPEKVCFLAGDQQLS